MAFAAVVNRVASTKEISVAAYATTTGAIFHCHPRRAPPTTARPAPLPPRPPPRAPGPPASRNPAATADRKHATCHPVTVAALIAAPPVENNNAESSSANRYRTVFYYGCGFLSE